MQVDVGGLIPRQDIDSARLMGGVARPNPQEETAAGELFFHPLQVLVFNIAIEKSAERCPSGARSNGRCDGSGNSAS
jgi:hypothetical protein